MKFSRFIPLAGAVVLFSSITLAVTNSGALAQDGTIFGGQTDNEASPEAKKPPLTITGAWTGTIDDNLAGEGTLDVEFTETSNGTLGGSWSFAFDAGTDFGTIKGKATSNSVDITFVFVPKKPFVHCRFSIKTKDASDSEIMSKYKFAACGPLTKKEHGNLTISPE